MFFLLEKKSIFFVVIDFFQLSFEKSSQIPELVKNLKTIRVCELTPQSQRLVSLPEDEQQVKIHDKMRFLK